MSLQDNVCLTEINVEERVEDFVRAAQDMAQLYEDDDLFWPMGTDFTYANALTWCGIQCFHCRLDLICLLLASTLVPDSQPFPLKIFEQRCK